jgi:RNA polymerase sigma-70 factor, ECF subfamily
LLQIVRNTAFTRLARQRTAQGREVPLDAPGDEAERLRQEAPDPGVGPERALQQRESLQRLDQLLAEMPAELRECLVLREMEESSYKEIVQITRAPIGTVMSRLWRARQYLLRARAKAEP